MAAQRPFTRRTLQVLVGACLIAVASAGEVAWAQTSPPSAGRPNYFTVKPPGSIDYVITDKPVIIAAQVQYALRRELKAREMLSAQSDFDSLASIVEIIHDGYVLLRTAQHGLEKAQSNSKFPNPALINRTQKIRDVRDHLLVCMNSMGLAQKWEDARYVTEASETLDTVVELLEALIPEML